MSTPDLAELFQTLALDVSLGGEPLPLPRPGRLVPQTRTGLEESAAREALAALGADARGWACLADHLAVEIAPTAMPTDKGLLLSAEFAAGETSVHIRLEDAGWRVTQFTREEGGAGWLIPQRFLSARPSGAGGGGRHLDYEVFWESREGAPFLATLSRFAGFSSSR